MVRLQAWQAGDEAMRTALTPPVYSALRRLAKNAFRGEHAGHTMQPKALVHEAIVKLIDAGVSW